MASAAPDVDFVIIGSGAGALVAAVEAKVAGLKPLVVEKTPLIGGSSALSGGILWVPDNPLMAREGVKDSREAALTYLANFTRDDDLVSTRARREAFVDNISPMVEAMEAQGMQYRRCSGYCDYYDHLPGGDDQGRSLQGELFDLNELGDWKERFRRSPVGMPLRTSEARELMLATRTPGGAKMAATLATRLAGQKLTGKNVVGSGGSLQGRMLQIVLKLGIEVWTDAGLKDLDIQGGKVIGAIIEHDGQMVRVAAPRGVLIAAGGFARNLAMREKYQPQPTSDVWTKANPGDTGEVIQIMEKAGAGLGMMEEAWWILTALAPGEAPHHAVLETSKPYGMIVDWAGQRFANESASYMEVGQRAYERNKTTRAVPAWLIMDARARRYYFWAKTPPGLIPDEWIKSGWMKRSGTIAGLATECGIDPAGLQATVERFNGFCKTGKDLDFQRGDNTYNKYFGDPTVKPNPNLGPIEQGPFLAVPLYPGDAGTCGGAFINERAEVMRADGSVIEGLYAAGNSTASLTGPYYVGPGTSIGASSVFGFIAARQAAQ